MTHDLLGDAVKSLGGEVRRIVVTNLDAGTFYSRVDLGAAGDTVSLDARPSDAIALALGAHAPIFVTRAVLDEAGEIDPNSVGEAGDLLGEVGCGLYLQPLDDELASAMGVTAGVIVADLAPEHESSGLERGDVIVRIDGEPADTIDGIALRLEAVQSGGEIVVDVVRGDDRREVTLSCP